MTAFPDPVDGTAFAGVTGPAFPFAIDPATGRVATVDRGREDPRQRPGHPRHPARRAADAARLRHPPGRAWSTTPTTTCSPTSPASRPSTPCCAGSRGSSSPTPASSDEPEQRRGARCASTYVHTNEQVVGTAIVPLGPCGLAEHDDDDRARRHPAAATVDYTDKDFASLRQAMLDLAAYRLPEWTDRSPADVGMLLVDLFAYVGDVLSYYQDRIASEAFLDTAVERRSVMHLLRLIGYELAPPVAATAELELVFNAPAPRAPTDRAHPGAGQRSRSPSRRPARPAARRPVRVPRRRPRRRPRRAGGDAAGRRPARRRSDRRAPVRHGHVDEVLGSSTGEPSQRFPLAAAPVLVDTLEVTVDGGTGPVRWDRQENLLFHRDTTATWRRHGDVAGLHGPGRRGRPRTSVVFGDGVYGTRPPVGHAQRRRHATAAGGGAAGNVAAGTITQAVTPDPRARAR